MNIKEVIIFFIVMLLIYFSGNLYIYKRSVYALSFEGRYLNYFRVLYLVIMLAFPVSMIAVNYFGNFLFSRQISIIGFVFMGAMLYALMIILLVDILRVVNHFVHFFPDIFTTNKIFARRIVFAVCFGIIFCIVTYGIINARYIRVYEQEIFFDKLKAEQNGFTIVQISDLHVGALLDKKFVRGVVDKINSLESDIMVITGDLIDNGATDLNQLDPLINLKSKFGIFFVSGNHDHFLTMRTDSTDNTDTTINNNRRPGPPIAGGFQRRPLAAKLEELNINVLHDRYVVIDSGFTLFGIEYNWGGRGGNGVAPKPLTEMLKGHNNELPLIMLKHVPNDLENISNAGVDLLLCGHTHHGQMFPISLITDKVYHVSHGYGKYKNLQLYVNCGVGFWGPPLKIGVPSEITKITLISNK